MSRKYKEELDKIVMTDQMKKRILHNVLNQEKKEEKSKKSILSNRKPFEALAASLLMAVSLIAAKNYVNIFNDKNSVEIENEQNYEETVDSNNSNEDNSENSNENLNSENINNSEDSYEQNSIMENKNTKNNLSDNMNGKEYNQPKVENKDDSGLKSSSNDSDIDKTKDKSVTFKEFKEDTSKKVSDTVENNVNEPKVNSSEESTKSGAVPRTAIFSGNMVEEYSTIKEAEAAVDIKSSGIEQIGDSYNISSISVIANEIIQIQYNNGKDYINFRAGKDIENVSGDYNSYKIENDININGTEIKISSNSDQKVNLAVWENENISYSMSSDEGINQSEITEMIKDILN